MPATATVLPRARAESQFAPCVVPENLICPASLLPNHRFADRQLAHFQDYLSHPMASLFQGVQFSVVMACIAELHVLFCLSVRP
jgi:hypothetical protein